MLGLCFLGLFFNGNHLIIQRLNFFVEGFDCIVQSLIFIHQFLFSIGLLDVHRVIFVFVQYSCLFLNVCYINVCFSDLFFELLDNVLKLSNLLILDVEILIIFVDQLFNLLFVNIFYILQFLFELIFKLFSFFDDFAIFVLNLLFIVSLINIFFFNVVLDLNQLFFNREFFLIQFFLIHLRGFVLLLKLLIGNAKIFNLFVFVLDLLDQLVDFVFF